jgi:bifunctional UDP-N-acetylglucosamine pyrophosphorylase / glucosamine-1-phosphate N-acetyltransferase
MFDDLSVVILAAGVGTRMKSKKAKVLHTIGDKPILGFVIEAAQSVSSDIIVVVGYQKEQIQKLSYPVRWVEQKKQCGTADALMSAIPYLDKNKKTLVLYGDVPLIKPDTLKKIIKKVNDNTICLLTINLQNPTGYGRIIRDKSNRVIEIIEQKDATTEQKKINEINTGIMALANKNLVNLLKNIKPFNKQNELYLTDIVSLAYRNNIKIKTINATSVHEVAGVNDKQQLGVLERVYQQTQAKKMMKNGLELKDYRRFDIRGSLKFGKDCTIDANVIFQGKNQIGNNVCICANCVLKNVKIENDVLIKPYSVLEDCEISKNSTIGPFARLRPDTKLKENSMIGNFVEIKKSTIGKNSKASHLSYIGDSDIGDGVNIGAGVITCNYDGANKHKTKISDDVFVGSDVQLIAPLMIDKGATIGAGSTITKNVKKNSLVLSRTKQQEIENWQRPQKEKNKKDKKGE